MNVERFKVGQRQEQQPFICASDHGCGLEGCNCSPTYFLSVSDGHQGLSAELTKQEFARLRQEFRKGKVLFAMRQEAHNETT
jgi:hypothetical protein